MVENRPVARVLSHLVLVLGVLIVAFPVYLTFVASTHTAQEIVQQAPMSLLPGDNIVQSYRLALFGGQTDNGARTPPVAPMLWISLVTRAGHLRSARSRSRLLSAFAVVYFRFPLRNFVFWMIFVTLMLPVEVRILPTYKVVVRPRHAQHLRRADGAADRLGHRHLPVPPVLPDRARRTGGGRAHRRRRARCASSRTCCCRCRAPRSRRCS